MATHTGLFRVANGGTQAARIADRYQDTMAFTVVGPGHFLGSGHPDSREDLPPFLGLIESRDGGGSWEEVSLMGEVDFHLLAARGEQVYGFGSAWGRDGSLLLVSTDGGRTWMKRPVPGPLVGLAVSPQDGEVLVASTSSSLYVSEDGGRAWRPLQAGPGLLTWPQGEPLYRVGPQGAISASDDSGRSWQAVGRIADAPAAFGSAPGRLLVATHDGAVSESVDGGSTWKARFQP